MARNRWSFKEDRRLMKLARSSKSLEEVVKITGRSPNRIKQMAMRLGLSIKPRAANSAPPDRTDFREHK